MFVGEPVTDVHYGVQVWGSVRSEIFVEPKFMCTTHGEAKLKPGVGSREGPIARAIQREQGSSCSKDLNSLKGRRESFKGKVREGNQREYDLPVHSSLID